MKLFFYDLETTGTLYWKHGIHQIAGAIMIDGEVKESFDFKVCPHEKALIEEDALKVGNVTKEQILAYPNMKEVYNQIISMLSKYCDKFDKKDKFHLVGITLTHSIIISSGPSLRRITTNILVPGSGPIVLIVMFWPATSLKKNELSSQTSSKGL